MGKFKITNRGLYWGLIATFIALYALVAFVSTLHAIDFFRLANIGALAILLGIAYEVGQATVLFSILMTKNKEKFLPWLLMILLTALQVTANVYASFKHMSLSGNEDWTYWYTSILKIFGVQGGNAETYQVIISWISGALLPIVALGMTALVAQNIKLITEEDEVAVEDGEEEPLEVGVDEQKFTPVSEEDRVKPIEEIATEKTGALAQEEIDKIRNLMDTDPIKNGAISENIKKVISPGLPLEEDMGDSPREQLAKILDDSSVMESPGVAAPKEEEDVPLEETQEFKDFVDNVLPVDEEISKEYDDKKVPLDLTQFKSPGVFTVDGDPRERGEESQESVIAPQPTSDDMGEMIEPLGDPVEVEPPKVVEEPPPVVEPTPEVKYETPEPVEETKPPEEESETEEERQERLRNIAREKLKKK